MSDFDPYYFFLGIPPKEQPPNYYRLLGIELHEPSDEIISAAADRQMGHLQQHESGEHVDAVAELLGNVSRARLCLLDPEKKAAYDAELKGSLAPAEPDEPVKAAEPVSSTPPLPKAVSVGKASTGERPEVAKTKEIATPVVRDKGHDRVSQRTGRRPLPLMAIGIGSAIALLILFALILLPGRSGTIRIEVIGEDGRIEAADVRVEIDGDSVALAALEDSIELPAAEHTIQVDGAGFETVSENFVVERGENEPLIVRVKSKAEQKQVTPEQDSTAKQDSGSAVEVASDLDYKATLDAALADAKAGQLVKAIDTLARMQTNRPEDATLVRHRARMLEQAGRKVEAAEEYQKLIALGEGSVEADGTIPPDDSAWFVWDAYWGNVQQGPSRWKEAGNTIAQSSNIHVLLGDEQNKMKQLVGTQRIFRGGGFSDGAFDCQVLCSDNDGIGIAFRLQDPEHYYSFVMNSQDGYRALLCRSGSELTVLDSTEYGYEKGMWYNISIVQDRGNLTVYIDGRKELEASDDTYVQGTVALQSSATEGVRFRGLKWNKGQTTPSPIPTPTHKLRLAGLLPGHTAPIVCARFSADGTQIISSSRDKTVRLWNVADGSLLATLTGHSSTVHRVAISADGRKAVSCGHDATVRLWDLGNKTEEKVVYKSRYGIHDLAIAPDGQHALAVIGGPVGPQYLNLETGKNVGLRQSGHKGGVANIFSTCISGDGTTAMTGNGDGRIRIHDLATRKQTAMFSEHTVKNIETMTISHDGNVAASRARELLGRSKRDPIMVWSVPDQHRLFDVPGWMASLSPDGSLLAVIPLSGVISLWSVPERRELTSLKVEPAYVQTVAFSPDGKRLVTAGDSKVIKIWDIVPIDAESQPDPVATTVDQDVTTLLSDDLSHWTVMTTSGRNAEIHKEGSGGWSLIGDAIRCETPNAGWLRSNEEYEDFELLLEFKLPPGGNSGVYVRCPVQGQLIDVGMEVQLIDDNAVSVTEDNRTGAITRAAPNNFLKFNNANVWNQMRIRCEGEQVQITLNGDKVVDVLMNEVEALKERPRRGYIGFSNIYGLAKGTEFRNVRLRRLGSP